ncbi:phospholipase A2 inhibitor and Ly6/PLAUR domain-containing protein [Lates calcarifer]|uniref:Phospholipase A2 inhibitor and Ly6/PLAUR domain-containing protein n=1 Tax=Lates calcarifer TaxID=8187 RepID=A0AAJ8DVY9_LATCA|nr:phospholipase A2 inhibitor and Ly6/PLAUR domain-containing protein [Lates calcarifer]
MKLILSLTLSWMLSTPAEALRCYTGQYSTKLQTCNSADEWCATVTIQETTQSYPQRQGTIRSCEPSSVCALQGQIQSHSNFYGAFTAYVRCCRTDGCNNQTLPHPKIDRKKNGLQCVSCTDAKGNLGVCNNAVQCVGVEDRCIQWNS